jgi:bifunctional DNA-binding transcriptional regulator/antitoxin component of YhaV-PrlF toxin-antitoxin module
MAITATITSKGQITIPVRFRDILKSKSVEIESDGEVVILRPVRKVGGALSKYSNEYIPIKKAREKVWEEVVHERNRNS